MYSELYEESRRADDLEKAISINDELTPATHGQLAKHLSRLGIALQKRFNQKGDMQDIERAIQLYQNALSLMDDADSDKPGYLSTFGNALEVRFDQLGNLEDIENSIMSKQN